MNYYRSPLIHHRRVVSKSDYFSDDEFLVKSKEGRVVIYARVSTLDQTVDNQLIELRDHCSKMGWEIKESREKLTTTTVNLQKGRGKKKLKNE